MKEHRCDRSCCEPRTLRIGRNLYNRLRGRPWWYSDRTARELARFEGQDVEALHTFEGPGGVYAYTVRAGDRLYHLPALMAEEAGAVAS